MSNQSYCLVNNVNPERPWVCGLELRTLKAVESSIEWMNSGQERGDKWESMHIDEVRKHLAAGTLNDDCYTDEAKADFKALIEA